MISVILTSCNASVTLEKAIQSVIDQSFHHWELIIVDNGSTDNSLQIAREYAANDERIRVKSINRVTIGGAHLHGIQQAKYDWITFLNGTDTLEPDALQWMWAHTPDDDVDEPVNMIIGGVRRITPSGSYAIKGNYNGLLSAQQYVGLLLRGDFIATLGGKLLHRANYIVGDTYLDSEVEWNHELIAIVAKVQSGSNVYINTTEYVYNLNDSVDEPQPGSFNFRGWLKSSSAMARFVESEETMFHFRLKDLYDNIIATGAQFPTNHPEIKHLRKESSRYELSDHEQHILKLLKSKRARRREAALNANRPHRPDAVLSVVMTCHNCQNDVARVIKSLQNQKFTEWELVVIDDFSVDRTAEIIHSFAACDHRIRLITSSERRGRPRSRLAGIQAARGKYIGFINPTDRFTPDALRSVWEVAENTNADVVVMGSKMASRKGWISFKVFDPEDYFTSPTIPMREAMPDMLNDTGIPYRQCDKFYKRQSLDVNSMTPDELVDDTLFNLRFMKQDGLLAWTDCIGFQWYPSYATNISYHHLIEKQREAYHRVLAVLQTEEWENREELIHNLRLGSVSHFLKYLARGLSEPWRAGVRRSILESLNDPGLVDCLTEARISPDLASVLNHAHRQFRHDRILIKKFKLIDRF